MSYCLSISKSDLTTWKTMWNMTVNFWIDSKNKPVFSNKWGNASEFVTMNRNFSKILIRGFKTRFKKLKNEAMQKLKKNLNFCLKNIRIKLVIPPNPNTGKQFHLKSHHSIVWLKWSRAWKTKKIIQNVKAREILWNRRGKIWISIE